jgi:hypothetical protein
MQKINRNIKVVRVSIGGARLVGINIFPNAIEEVKAIISEGIPESERVVGRINRIPQLAFFNTAGQALIKHDCLSTNGVEILRITRDPAWTHDTLIFARCFEIPISDSVGSESNHLKEVLWNIGPTLYVNGLKMATHGPDTNPLVLDMALFQYEHNELKIVSNDRRFFVVIQTGTTRSISEVCLVLSFM